MFRNTRKKQLKNRIIAVASGVVIMTFGIWLNYKDAAENNAKETAQKVTIEEKVEEPEESNDLQDDNETVTNDVPVSYLIKEVNGVVKVFLCDDSGKKELYLITSIPFDLLSESDQQLFEKGVKLDTEEDLGKFLENFDS